MPDGLSEIAFYECRLRWERLKLAISETWLRIRGVKGDMP